MLFDESKSIFLQISDYVKELILKDDYIEEERIPSVREMAAQMEVNPNTVLRSYARLQEEGIINNQRGLGYFVAPGAARRVLAARREEFIRDTLPQIFRTMTVLQIDLGEVEEFYKDYVKRSTK